MNSLLLVIDLQEAFINDNTKIIVEKIRKLVDDNKYDKVVFTRFLNNYESIWSKKLNYNECITEESRKIVIETKDNLIIDKNTYSVLTDELKEFILENDITDIYLCGIDTECCVLKSALDLFENGYNVYVLKDFCACTHGLVEHNNAIEILKRCIGKEYII